MAETAMVFSCWDECVQGVSLDFVYIVWLNAFCSLTYL